MPMICGEFWARANGEDFEWGKSKGDGSLGQKSYLNKAME